jgi:hypothetical protein
MREPFIKLYVACYIRPVDTLQTRSRRKVRHISVVTPNQSYAQHVEEAEIHSSYITPQVPKCGTRVQGLLFE